MDPTYYHVQLHPTPSYISSHSTASLYNISSIFYEKCFFLFALNARVFALNAPNNFVYVLCPYVFALNALFNVCAMRFCCLLGRVKVCVPSPRACCSWGGSQPENVVLYIGLVPLFFYDALKMRKYALHISFVFAPYAQYVPYSKRKFYKWQIAKEYYSYLL
jgi:hypothetical protein